MDFIIIPCWPDRDALFERGKLEEDDGIAKKHNKTIISTAFKEVFICLPLIIELVVAII